MATADYIPLLEEYLEEVYFENDEKGRRLYRKKGKGFAVAKFDDDEIKVIVPSETSRDTYKVTFSFDYGDGFANAECTCPAYDSYDECKHCVAAAIFIIEDYISPQAPQETLLAGTQPGGIAVHLGNLSYYNISKLSRKDYGWRNYRLTNAVRLAKQEGAKHWFTYTESAKKNYEQELLFLPPHTLEVTCSCGKAQRDNLCQHLIACLTYLGEKHGDYYFNQFKDFTTEKNTLLSPYGVTMADDEAKHFVFGFDYNGVPVLKEAPPYLVKISDAQSLTALARQLAPQKANHRVDRPLLPADKFIHFDLGYLLNFSVKQLIHFSLQPLAVSGKNGKTTIEKITLGKTENLAYLKAVPDEEYILFEKLTDDGMKKHLIKEGFSHLKSYGAWQQQVDSNAIETLRKQYHATLKALWPYLLQQEYIYKLDADKSFSAKNIERTKLGDTFPAFRFKVVQDQKFITLQLLVTIAGETFPATERRDASYLFITANGTYYLLEEYGHVKLMQQFAYGVLKFPATHRMDVLRKIVMPLQQHYEVEIDEALRFESRKGEPLCQVVVSEYQNQYLMLKPEFIYEGTTVDYSDEPDILVQGENGFSVIEREKEEEKQFFEKLRYLHPLFAKQNQNPFYFLPFADVMKDNWFLHAVRRLQEENITVKGMQDLQKFRYNTATPKWEMKTGSGTDWFDLQITVSFGDQQVPVRDIQKAIRSGQKIVVLGDGTFGVLPEEWLQEYGMLMKMAEEDNGHLRINKMHFTVIDELHGMINEEDVLRELAEKKQRLQQIETITPRPVSKHIKAKLRPYQQSGFNWMQVLNELSWGGCLADDMGLGKTLQAICFLQYVKEKYEGAVSLVVCPTSLIYNWESELQKFAPSLRYHIYHGANREFSGEHLEQYDVVITSYGTLRLDIKELGQHDFHYLILDESQHIKNPDAQVTKAAQIIKTKNRLILSGTPVQNNTFDLYAQMNFLNPGFLGNKEFFKTEFASPIDKSSDAATAAQLRRLIYPFMLRRTKEQVAKELPDKTETVLWCEMEKEQRTVYDEYRQYYRHRLLNKIEEEGMNKAAIYILEGLLRLRQICDSPALLKDKEVTTTASVKLEELLREVEENTGDHKLLIFSQFTEMLGLVKDRFIKQNIPHLYLDGSTPAAKRKGLVEQFQTDSSIKAFLISLKAGGVGLNLTAADYVYLIDPWWNPAVEDQAIDRTHRIGQTNKVFAYKMICKDTVEEKILQLQQKKKSLTKELISEEAGFIKKLSKEDVMFLFG